MNMVMVKGFNEFYEGWVTCFLGFPKSSCPKFILENLEESWLAGYKTCLKISNNPALLYETFLQELKLSNIYVIIVAEAESKLRTPQTRGF